MNSDQIFTAYDLLALENSEERYISTGCRILDEFFKGGLRKGILTEITGEAGTGKTQFSLQLLMESLVSADGKDIDGKGIYVTTQKPVNEKRLEELKYGFISRRFSHLTGEEITAIDEKINNSLIFHKAVTLPEFLVSLK